MKYAPQTLKKTIKKNASDMIATTSGLLGGGSGEKSIRTGRKKGEKHGNIPYFVGHWWRLPSFVGARNSRLPVPLSLVQPLTM